MASVRATQFLTTSCRACRARLCPRPQHVVITPASRRQLSTSTPRPSSSQFNRSDFGNQPFNGVYEPREPTGGPLSGASMVGVPRITPRMLKDHLDQFVVGQERGKKVLSTAVFNHYQRIQELRRQDEEFEELMAQQARKEMRHPLEDEFPGQQQTVTIYPPGHTPTPPESTTPFHDPSPLTIDKSNVLLLGPSGVGKTLMAKTLARVLDVPFSMSDCTPLTQAGYIGEDAEVIVQRLLAAANYDVARAENGIICLDEIDKIATAKVSHGKDVSGEGVQQALLKIIEGTTLQIQAKQERSNPSSRPGGPSSPTGYPSQSPLGQGNGMNTAPPAGGGGKAEVFNVRTDNILFICTGAFIGLHKVILDRISKGSIGFGATVRGSIDSSSNPNDTRFRGDPNLIKEHLPFFYQQTPTTGESGAEEQVYNTLDLVEPADLQKYGMIPELIGRIPISCALSSLDINALVRVLTEPRNALLRQYEQLFSLSGIELRFTTAAMHVVASEAAKMSTGARGLRTVLERLLGDVMFEAPGSTIKYILLTEAVAQRKLAPLVFVRGQQHNFHGLIAQEEEEWERKKNGESPASADSEQQGATPTFEEYRKIFAAGSS